MDYVEVSEHTGYIPGAVNIGVLRNGNEVILIDTGLDKDSGRKTRRLLEEHGLQLKAIINTHSHADHFGGNAYYLANFILLAASQGADIINISQQGINFSMIRDSIKAVIDAGVLVVASAGNGVKVGGNCPTGNVWPAAYNADPIMGGGMLAVGASANDVVADWGSFCSNSASWIDLYAPGVEIESAAPNNRYAKSSGTSFSTALTSGAAAILWSQHPDWTPQQVQDQLVSHGHLMIPSLSCQNGPCRRLNISSALQ